MTNTLTETRAEPIAAPFEVATDPVRENFWRAADLIEEHGWLQCDLGGPGRGFCVLGAVNYARFGRETCTGQALGPDDDAVMQRLSERTGASNLAIWNNDPERTKEEVVGILRELADS